jgi:chaperonin cofactor prefoldin
MGVPDEVLKFAPKKVRGDGVPIDQCGSAIVEMLQRAGQQLGAAEDRISRLETEIERVQDRAVRAETWLEQAQEEIEEKLIEPATAARSKLDDLGP